MARVNWENLSKSLKAGKVCFRSNSYKSGMLSRKLGGEKACTGGYEELYLLLIELMGNVALTSKAYPITWL